MKDIDLVFSIAIFRLEICAFSGQKIYPGRGRLFVRSDNRVSGPN